MLSKFFSRFFSALQPKHLFKVTFSYSAFIDFEHNAVAFKFSSMDSIYVVAADKMDAQVKFAALNVLYPHVYIHSIESAD